MRPSTHIHPRPQPSPHDTTPKAHAHTPYEQTHLLPALVVPAVHAHLAREQALEGEDSEHHLRPVGAAVDEVPVEEVLALLVGALIWGCGVILWGLVGWVVGWGLVVGLVGAGYR